MKESKLLLRNLLRGGSMKNKKSLSLSHIRSRNLSNTLAILIQFSQEFDIYYYFCVWKWLNAG